MTKVIGFDLDDTLVPEVLFTFSGIRHIAHILHKKYPILPEARIIGRMDTAVMSRRNHYSALEELLDEYAISDAIDMKDVVAEFRSHKPDPSIYHLAPSTIDLLRNLDAPDIRKVLITDGRSLTQRNKIKAAGLDEFFDAGDIYISEETGHDKTDPYSFLRVMEKYAGAEAFYYIGDNPPKDFLHPSRLGWHTHQAHPFPLAVHQGMPR